MRLEDRKEQILDLIVRHYVSTAVPVSSGVVFEKNKLDVSSATIRNTMLELDQEGYLIQPYTSAGRVPTEKGYRYFIKYLAQERTPPQRTQREIDRVLTGLEDDIDNVFDDLSRVLARHLKLFSGVGVIGNEHRIFSHGVAEVLREPEFAEHNMAVQFAHMVDHMEDELERMSDSKKMSTIDIGTFGMVSATFCDKDVGRCVLFSIGPRRMNYEAAQSLLKYTADDIIREMSKA